MSIKKKKESRGNWPYNKRIHPKERMKEKLLKILFHCTYIDEICISCEMREKI